ncbi:hypothetical protein VPH35_032600 [Triticum aestivum]
MLSIAKNYSICTMRTIIITEPSSSFMIPWFLVLAIVSIICTTCISSCDFFSLAIFVPARCQVTVFQYLNRCSNYDVGMKMSYRSGFQLLTIDVQIDRLC